MHKNINPKRNKTKYLRFCNSSLLVLTLGILVSGIQLEATHSTGFISIWTHIIIGILFMGMVTYHLYLHFGQSNWFARFRKIRNQATRVLWWTSIITFITGIITTIHWIIIPVHSVLGGIHGKFGFLMVILSIAHIYKRRKFFMNK